jgi:hypothetical protein
MSKQIPSCSQCGFSVTKLYLDEDDPVKHWDVERQRWVESESMPHYSCEHCGHVDNWIDLDMRESTGS